MSFPTDRPGYAEGVLVEFRHENTNEILWESSLQLLPQKGDIVWYVIGAGVLTDYDVKSVKWEFRKMTRDVFEGDPEEVITGLSDCLAIVVVKEVP